MAVSSDIIYMKGGVTYSSDMQKHIYFYFKVLKGRASGELKKERKVFVMLSH